MCRVINSSSRANNGCTAAAWANARAGTKECKSVTATADFALLDRNCLLEIIEILFGHKKAQKTQKIRFRLTSL
jgi:hypothetical protein